MLAAGCTPDDAGIARPRQGGWLHLQAESLLAMHSDTTSRAGEQYRCQQCPVCLARRVSAL